MKDTFVILPGILHFFKGNLYSMPFSRFFNTLVSFAQYKSITPPEIPKAASSFR